MRHKYVAKCTAFFLSTTFHTVSYFTYFGIPRIRVPSLIGTAYFSPRLFVTPWENFSKSNLKAVACTFHRKSLTIVFGFTFEDRKICELNWFLLCSVGICAEYKIALKCIMHFWDGIIFVEKVKKNWKRYFRKVVKFSSVNSNHGIGGRP